ncbi:MAG: helix-turn-helix domain-containing protein [Candidatus Competibacteraceae bacterium]|nr:helix-turn-helix domain-containing protein [Candidatus Competibacteraceae bacterium]
MKRIGPLSAAECETLREAWKDDPNGRVRQRAQAGYSIHRGYRRIVLAALFEVYVNTINTWLDGWEDEGLWGLYDEPRSGRPPIYTLAEAARLCGWLDEEPRQIKRAQARLEQTTGKQASRQTVRRIVKKKPIVGSGAGDRFAITPMATVAAHTARTGKLHLVILDNAPIHTSRTFQARHRLVPTGRSVCTGCHPTVPNSTSSKFSGEKASTNGFRLRRI